MRTTAAYIEELLSRLQASEEVNDHLWKKIEAGISYDERLVVDKLRARIAELEKLCGEAADALDEANVDYVRYIPELLARLQSAAQPGSEKEAR